MQLTIARTALLAALARASRIVERKNTIPILSHVMLSADAHALTIHATDLDMTVGIACPAKVATPGRITTPAHVFHDIVKRLPDNAEISLGVDPETHQIQIASGRSRFRVPSLPADDFPAFDVPEAAARFDISGGELVRMISRTQSAMSSDETRYYLNGIFLHACPGEDGKSILRAVATNGHILSLAQTTVELGEASMPGVIVPAKAVRELKKLAEEHSGQIQISISSAKVEAVAGDTVLASKLIDGTYPDYVRVIPMNNARIVTADLAPLREAIDRVSVVGAAADKGLGTQVRFGLVANKAVLSTAASDAGSAEEELPVDYDGSDFAIGFAHKYMLTAIDSLDADTIRIELGDAETPAIIRSLASSPELFVLMPFRLKA